MNVPINVRCESLPAAKSAAEYQSHCDALEWSLADPIIIHSSDDIKSRGKWERNVEPFKHQVENLIRFCRRLPVTLLADDVGLGKTISAGLILSELMTRKRVSKTMVICPKILIDQWEEELYTKFGIIGKGATASDIGRARNSSEVVITTYQSASNYLSKVREDDFQMLILDEAHKIRNLHGTKSPPKMAKQIHAALKNRIFKYALLLTATPIQNRLWDIYSLIDCLTAAKGHKNPFGSPEEFTARFIEDGKNSARVIKPRMAEKFRQIAGQYMFRTRRIDVNLAFPTREVKTYAVPPTDIERQLLEVVRNNIRRFSGLIQSSILVALMSSPDALLKQANNMAEKDPQYSDLADEVAGIVRKIKCPVKLKAVLKLVDELKTNRPDNWRMVIFTTRLETQARIAKELSDQGISWGLISGGQAARNAKTIESFKRDIPDINVIISTDAGSEGVNLQVANVLVNYDLPWNPMIVEQRIGRVQRLASEHKEIYVVNIVHQDSPEEHIVGRLSEKLQLIAHSVGDIEAVLGGDGKDAGDSFEKQMRDLVIKSLEGQDTRQAEVLAEQSIEEAKEIFEQQREDIDQKLGDISGDAPTDVLMPKLTQLRPNKGYKEFVLEAMASGDGELSEIEKGLYARRSRHDQEKFTFDESIWQNYSRAGVFHGVSPALYQPGKPAFERFVQKWVDNSAARVFDLSSDSESELGDLVKGWLRTIDGAKLKSFNVVSRKKDFQGELVCRSKAANALDSYEKLVRIPITSQLSIPINKAVNDRIIQREVSPTDFIPDIETLVENHVRGDSDIGKFSNYYFDRLNVELAKSDTEEKRKRLEFEFKPQIFAETCAVSGCVAQLEHVKVVFRIGEGDHSYTAEITCCSAIKSLLSEPERTECALSQNLVPNECVARCAVTGKLACAHLMEALDNGELVIPDEVSICEATGGKARRSSIATCSITGKRVLKRLLFPSDISGRLAIESELQKCEISGKVMLSDEVAVSDISGKRFRFDEKTMTSTDGRTAHQSEVGICAISNMVFPLEEMVRSQVSERLIHTSNATTSEKSGLTIGIDEVKICSQTKKRLASNEGVMAESDGNFYDKELLHCSELSRKWDLEQFIGRSEASGRLGLRSEIVTCEKSGRMLLADEVGRCEISGIRMSLQLLKREAIKNRLVDRELLGQCEITKHEVLLEDLVRCEISGKNVAAIITAPSAISKKIAQKQLMIRSVDGSNYYLPDEVEKCAATNAYFPRDQIKTCYVTGTRNHISQLARSEVSQRWALKSKLKPCGFDGSKYGPDEAALCFWSGKEYSKKNVVECTSTGVHVARLFVNESSEFSLIKIVLNNANHPSKDLQNGVKWLSSLQSMVFAGLRSVRFISNEKGNRHLLFGDIKIPFFAQKKFVCFMSGSGGNVQLMGNLVIRRDEHGVLKTVKRIIVGPYV
ncbi:DEAD/DEAH box helicase [Pirellulaceae bacterium]|nr:DEAD/DEAH box helicase [Pirellulaceae bacterium]